ncbi:hypothetical protein [Streptomyces mobaraensis]|uniref:4'-phosphopantetheinyl transferase superfamily protein n=1 Tax=Streptomyces mobaraensis TaxID=35621 RepID=A0A5N5VZC7_STRMB|nr:hypothetical protein [Streptomyces mobaraensis]KAB7834291.1 hypothetical protein FRZ00_30280 [Streptomyces mobaraensis]
MIPAEERTGTLYVRLTAAPRLPRDAFGRRSSPPGRVLLRAAAGAAAGLHQPPERLPDGRWHWPDSGWRGSVSHTGALGLVALARGVWVGADVQEHRERPAALRWLARVLGRPPGAVATVREWTEVEALLKARGTAGVRPERLDPLPGWRPGWRDAGGGWWLWSGTLAGAGFDCLSGPGPGPDSGSGPGLGSGLGPGPGRGPGPDSGSGPGLGSGLGPGPRPGSGPGPCPETYVALAARAPLAVRPLPPYDGDGHPAFPAVPSGADGPGDPAGPASLTGPAGPRSPSRTKGTQR